MDAKLDQELRNTLADIQGQMQVVFEESRRMEDDVTPATMKYADGTYVMVPLLVAKAQVLNALVTLRGRNY